MAKEKRERKAVITILGLAGGKYDKDEGAINFHSKHYYYQNGEENNKALYSNTLPYLIDKYASEYKIVPIYTQIAKDVQSKILIENESKEEFLNIFEHGYEIIDENDFNQILNSINESISSYDKIIFDMTHGFRHLPILAIINLIMHNIKESEKIESILFGKEIVKADQGTTGKYDIINLDKYLGLAKLSFVLTSFKTNYTVGNKLVFNNEKYQEVTDSLRKISSHILANSIKTLIMGETSLILQTIENLEILQREDKNIKTFSLDIKDIIDHLNEIQMLKNEKDHMRLFKLSQMMKEREYLLNSITLLNESVGMFCSEKIKSINNVIHQHIDGYLKNENGNLYELAHQSKNIIKRAEDYSGSYLYEPEKVKLTPGQKSTLQKKKQKLKKQIPASILEQIEKNGFKIELSEMDKSNKSNIKNIILKALEIQKNEELKTLIAEIENLRNNLAHGNTSEEVRNVKGDISRLSRQYEKIIKQFEDKNTKEIPAEVKKKKQKTKKPDPTGIHAAKEKTSSLEDKFNNR